MIKISKHQQKKNSKVLEYLLDNTYIMAFKEVVISKNSKWRVFKLYARSGWLKIRYHALWGIQTHYQKNMPVILPKVKKTNYLPLSMYLGKLCLNKIMLKILKECPKESIRGDINFSRLLLLKILSNSRVNYMMVEYYL